jgi:hypothetical protein
MESFTLMQNGVEAKRRRSPEGRAAVLLLGVYTYTFRTFCTGAIYVYGIVFCTRYGRVRVLRRRSDSRRRGTDT